MDNTLQDIQAAALQQGAGMSEEDIALLNQIASQQPISQSNGLAATPQRQFLNKKGKLDRVGNIPYFSDNPNDGDGFYRSLETLMVYDNAHRELIKNRGGVKDIVMDIDETILDNSNTQDAMKDRAKAYKSFSKALDENHAVEQAAGTVPGAIEFLRSAKENGARIHLVTGRKNNTANINNLLNNLEALGIKQGELFDTIDFVGYDKSGTPKQVIFDKYQPQMSIGDSDKDAAKGSTFFKLPNYLY